ncbi:hypothetical protein [Flagellimonas meridianipacifica]|uniref:Uncharacterized protein n=1 Tax=Flagellimonas meridianipacifica TaxID=1080225 RepID=A0A2T0MHZ5_9FLAO|nr:hypothetical protein [Allomuricauda pacifica]PRX57208.1 hypothetical protein CLV81_1211 [Allomuricauda pacifica]
MLKKIVRHITEGNLYQGLEVHTQESQESYALLNMRYNKEELHPLDSVIGKTLEELLPHIEKSAPVLVTFNSAQVLKKHIVADTNNNPERLLNQAFPNLELDNFYYQVTQAGSNAIVSISKKVAIDGYLAQLKERGIVPIQIALGLSHMDVLANYVEGTLMGSNFEVHYQRGNLVAFKAKTNTAAQEVEIGNLALLPTQLLCFAQIVAYLNSKPKSSNLQLINGQLGDTFKNARIFDFGIKGALGLFLVVLLGNFLIFNHYHTANQQLESSLPNVDLQDLTLKQLQQRVTSKEERLQLIAKSKNSRTSLYFDKLAMDIPSSVQLQAMHFQPLRFPVRKDKPIELQEHSLQIAGITNDKNTFTLWADHLEMQDWIRRVDILDYEYVSNSSASFTLNLMLNEAE